MADINKFIPFILKWEGGFVNDPLDSGGVTNMGVTLKTWQNSGYDKNNDGIIDEEDLKLIFRKDLIESVLRPHYWDRWQADKIKNQSIAHILVEQKTIVIKFDTSMPKDSVTGMYPVGEIILTNLVKGTEKLSTTINLEREHQSQSNINAVEEQLQVTGKETVKSETRLSGASKKYWAIASVVIISLIFLYLFLRKK